VEVDLTRHVEGDETAGGSGREAVGWQWKSDTRDSKRYAKGRLIADVEGLAGWRAGGLEGWRAGGLASHWGWWYQTLSLGPGRCSCTCTCWLHGELSKAA
jgi:hypothetical protein